MLWLVGPREETVDNIRVLTIMKKFRSFVRKEYIHIFRDSRTMLILLVLPVVMILLFGFAITTEVRNANVGYIAPHRDVTVDRVLNCIDASSYFTLTVQLHDESEVEEAFRQGLVNVVLVANEDNSALQIIADGSDPNQASMIVNYLKGVIAGMQGELMAGVSSQQQIVVTSRMLYNPQQKSAYNFVPGVMGLILMLICAMMTSIAIVREKETGTMEVLLASPLPASTIILAKLVPYFTLSMVNIGTILVLSVYVLDVPVQGSLVLLLGICLIFVLLALSLGLFISTITASQTTAMLASGVVLMMPVMLLSGMMFPIESMPAILQYISAIVPARWFIDAVKKVMLQGATLADVVKEVAILSSMAVLFITVSWKNFKTRLA